MHQVPKVQRSRCHRSGNGATHFKETPWTMVPKETHVESNAPSLKQRKSRAK